MKGCLPLLLIFAALMYLEAMWIQSLGLPHAWWAAFVLALGASMVLGSVHGLWAARRKLDVPETPLEQWQEGATLRLGGILRARHHPLTTPVTGRSAVMYEYEMRPQIRASTMHDRRREGAVGMDMAECVLETPFGTVPLQGFPTLREVPEQQFSASEHRAAMVNHLTSTPWHIRGDTDPDSHWQDLMGAALGEPGRLPLHMLNARTLDLVQLPTWKERGIVANPDQVRQMVDQGKWLVAERVVEQGAHVTVTGTYHAMSHGLDIGRSLSLQGAQHGIKLGAAKGVAAAEWRTTLVMAVILVLLTFGVHYLVYGNDGLHYRALVEQIGEMR